MQIRDTNTNRTPHATKKGPGRFHKAGHTKSTGRTASALMAARVNVLSTLVEQSTLGLPVTASPAPSGAMSGGLIARLFNRYGRLNRPVAS